MEKQYKALRKRGSVIRGHASYPSRLWEAEAPSVASHPKYWKSHQVFLYALIVAFHLRFLRIKIYSATPPVCTFTTTARAAAGEPSRLLPQATCNSSSSALMCLCASPHHTLVVPPLMYSHLNAQAQLMDPIRTEKKKERFCSRFALRFIFQWL